MKFSDLHPDEISAVEEQSEKVEGVVIDALKELGFEFKGTVEDILILGSFAKGYAAPHSDIDLAVIFESFPLDCYPEITQPTYGAVSRFLKHKIFLLYNKHPSIIREVSIMFYCKEMLHESKSFAYRVSSKSYIDTY